MGYRRMLSALCLVCILAMLANLSPLAGASNDAKAGRDSGSGPVLDILEVAATGIELLLNGGETGWGHSGITPDDKLKEVIEQQGELIDQVQEGLNEIQAGLAHMYAQLNLQDAMQNAWNDIPTILTSYNQLNNEIAELEYGNPDNAKRVDQWARNVVDIDNNYYNMEDTIIDFWGVLTQTGVGANQTPVLQQMKNFALNELKGNGPKSDFSTTVESTNSVPIIAERPMYFNYNGVWDGGSCQSGLGEPAKAFYFAEGTTRPNFDSFLCVQNPGEADTNVKITYMRGDGTTLEKVVMVPKHTRSTVNVGDLLGHVDSVASDFSAKVESLDGPPIVAERPMYYNYKGAWRGGHCNAGVTSTATELYFAEGTTRPGFDSYICLQNPESKDAEVKVTYMRGDGTTRVQDVVVPAHTRSTVKVNEVFGGTDSQASDFSAKVESTNGVGIVAERPMYFNYRNAWLGGHCESGRVAPASDFYFAEGTTRPNFDSFISLQNPGEAAADVTITYMRGDGTSQEQNTQIPPRSRITVKPSDVLGTADSAASDFSAKVQSTNGVKILAERPMYFNYKGKWGGGHTEAGLLTPARKFYFAEGTVRPNFESYLCIQNPNDTDANVKITYMKGDGTTQEQNLTVPKHSRQTVTVGDSYQGATLMDAYQRYLESFFTQCLYYQLMAATAQCNALDYLYHDNPNRDSKWWLTSADKFYDKWMKDETDMFISCVEQLVMTQAQLSGDWGSSTSFEIPGAYDVLSRADFIRRAAMGQIPLPDPDSDKLNVGLFGRIIATQDVLPKGQVPAITATKDGGAPVDYSSGINPGIQWISTSNSPLSYDMWVPDPQEYWQYQFSLNNEFSSAVYTFDGLDGGTYTIKDDKGNTLATASVEPTTAQNPLDPTKTIDVYYGYFLSTQRHSLLNDPSLWTTQNSYTDGPTGDSLAASTVVRDSQKGEIGTWAWANGGSSSVDYHNHLISASFVAQQDMKGVVFHFNVGANLCSEGMGDSDSLSSYPDGFVYTHRGYTWDSGSASAGFDLSLHDLGVDKKYTICSAPISVNLPANGDIATYTRRQGFASGYTCVATKPLDLTAGHIYNINFQVLCTIKTGSAQGQVNMKGKLKGLGASNI